MGSMGHLLKLLQAFLCFGLVQGHGRLIEPPSRSSMWRFGYHTPINYNDNQLFCGGFGVQYSASVGGKCGVCGDPWNGPRENEYGGKYATGTIVRKYEVGQVIDITVDLTANHKGYFEFRLCQKDSTNQKATWDCMNKHLLIDDKTGSTRHPIEYKLYSTKINYKLRLPKNVKCKACVLQWKYNAGNSWGVDKNGKGCVGCGNQEQFYGCADVAIGYDKVKVGRSGDQPCVYKQVRDDEWHWDCSGKMNSVHSIFNPNNNARKDSPFLFIYLICILMITFHNRFIRS